jgi:hypothetical protein
MTQRTCETPIKVKLVLRDNITYCLDEKLDTRAITNCKKAGDIICDGMNVFTYKPDSNMWFARALANYDNKFYELHHICSRQRIFDIRTAECEWEIDYQIEILPRHFEFNITPDNCKMYTSHEVEYLTSSDGINKNN